MARKLRVEYPGAIYHVMNRGDRREPIFRDEADRKRFVETLGETCVRSDRWSRGERPRAVDLQTDSRGWFFWGEGVKAGVAGTNEPTAGAGALWTVCKPDGA